MDRTALNKYISEIMANLSDQGRISEILTDITNENNVTETTLSELTETNKTLTSYNQSLVKANNKILVQLGNQNSEIVEEDEEPKKEEPKDMYEELPDLDDILKEE